MNTETVGSCSNVLTAGADGRLDVPGPLGTVLSRAKGCELWDTAGHRYLDFSMGRGSVLVGHAHPGVVEAVGQQSERGSTLAFVNEQSLALGEALRALSPACEQVRFCLSGAEATRSCERLARAHTGRLTILRFDASHHGAVAVPATHVFTGRSRTPQAPGVAGPDAHGTNDDAVLVAQYNDLAAAQQTIEQRAHALAGVVVQPLQQCIPPKPNFLAGLRAATAAHDIPLVFDETVTGFRLSYGGAQEYYGVVPDLVAYGEALGGGYPIAALGGRREIMSVLGEDWPPSPHAGNAVSAAAALAALTVYREPQSYAHLHDLGAYLRAGMRCALNARSRHANVVGDGPLARMLSSAHTHARLARGLLARGVFLHPADSALYLSLAHSRASCDEFLTHFGAAIDEEVTND